MNAIQQLRKGAGLELKDVVEVFFCEEDGVTLVEDAVAGNVALFEAKFRGAIPLPSRFAPKWSVTLKSETVEIGGCSVVVSICRPTVAARDGLDESALTVSVLSTLEPSDFTDGQAYDYSLDGKAGTFTEGTDFWTSAVQKVRSTKAVEWM